RCNASHPSKHPLTISLSFSTLFLSVLLFPTIGTTPPQTIFTSSLLTSLSLAAKLSLLPTPTPRSHGGTRNITHLGTTLAPLHPITPVTSTRPASDTTTLKSRQSSPDG